MNDAKAGQGSPQAIVRCAIYTRKSTEEGLEQEFNSLMAQRESAEAYVLSQREQGWTVSQERYDDGGFSGGNMERPALKRLLAEVEAKRIDCVVVYKVDRLSRSLLDFAAIIGALDKHNATFVSVTQQFNTNTSLGRLTLNVLLSFAQFEREIISERTRDKVFAARRKGKWTGGHPTLGYDLDAGGGRLHVNEVEAQQVREIFQIFLHKGKLIETLHEIDRRGWKTKAWTTRQGTIYGGNPFTRHTLEYLLSNPIHLGKVRLKGELHEGEHPAIVEVEVWRRANTLLRQNQQEAPTRASKPQEAILRGLLYCQACQTPMVPTYTKRRARRVRYYICLTAQKRGWKTCSSGALSARLIEESIGHQIGVSLGNPLLTSLQDLIERVSYDGRTRQVSITFREGLSPMREQHNNVLVFTLAATPAFESRGQTRPGRLPRVTRLMALAIRFEGLLRAGEIKDFGDLARLGRVTRARISQIMNLLNLAPDLQERLLTLAPALTRQDEIHERTLRMVLLEPSWKQQRQLFEAIEARCAPIGPVTAETKECGSPMPNSLTPAPAMSRMT